MTALQLELVQYDKKLENLKDENDQLVQRWMKKMSTEAEYMNDVNLELQRARRASLLSPNTDIQSIDGNFFSSSVNNPAVLSAGTRNSRVTWSAYPRSVKKRIDARSSELHTMDISNDGHILATGGQEKTVNLYDSMTGEIVYRLKGCLSSVNHVKISSDNRLAIAGSSDTSIYTWDLARMKLKDTLSGHIGKVTRVAISKDSSRIVSCSQDRTIKIWDVKKNVCTKTIFSSSSCTDMCPLDYNCNTIVAGHMDNSIRFWDTQSGNSIHEIPRLHRHTITSVSCSEDGRLLLTNSRDGTLNIIDTRTYLPTVTMSAKDYKPTANWGQAKLSPDERYVAAGSMDGNIFFWDLAKSGKSSTMVKLYSQSPVVGLCWHPNTTLFYSVDVKGSITTME
ncbi:hypothetical protein H4219_002654 [Mycoemilia scoparia]|uniref:Autophagy-related protein 16 domain-containing protein n=1 Tax=Mycoemilia scoparia TaxID=417184 RepID=A0A9W7ZX31_9FUNG|nr:hypothetical protein H4219_002654 [Mycoemilia scoparia]